jgi:mRNA interferase RelE/StbE
MTYVVEFTKSAQKELKKLPKSVGIRIAKAILKLSENPRVGKVRPMVGVKSWRLKVGDYRVIYDISDDILTVLVIRVRHRKDVYK